jgi:hypothetical protein
MEQAGFVLEESQQPTRPAAPTEGERGYWHGVYWPRYYEPKSKVPLKERIEESCLNFTDKKGLVANVAYVSDKEPDLATLPPIAVMSQEITVRGVANVTLGTVKAGRE